eukprot:gnl/TRDRNA2_/TRDRNA2_141572_c3_seq1.p1 gnl/TRDRNA2_/TRDRNA2_141572_c3~~gnl/TRDRNA2_/TRDRNA2_141572_c3_seq1.p1  ORF type:complete len:548 (-),score=39.54 gnl/TRDRNA2_/TRDRNA2_141572_c3_seq1:13-1512(-)
MDVEAFLRYLYLGELGTLQDPFALLRLWPFFCGLAGSGGFLLVSSKGLRGKWRLQLQGLLTPSNVVQVLAMIERSPPSSGLDSCKKAALRFVLRHKQEVLHNAPEVATQLGQLQSVNELLWHTIFSQDYFPAKFTAWHRLHPDVDARNAGDDPADWDGISARSLMMSMTDAAGIAMRHGPILVIGGRTNFTSRDRERHKLPRNERPNFVWRSHDNGQTWARIIAPWPGRTSTAVVETRSVAVVVMGGVSDEGIALGDVWSSEDEGMTWACLLQDAPWGARADAKSVCTASGALLLLGGETRLPGQQQSTHLTDLWRSKDNGRTWHLVMPVVPWCSAEAKWRATVPIVAALGGVVLAMAWSGMWMSEDEGTTWAKMSSTNYPRTPRPSKKRWRATVTVDGTVVLACSDKDEVGSTLGTLLEQDVWRSWDEGSTWNRIASFRAEPHSFLLATRDGSVLSMLAGRGGCVPSKDVSFESSAWCISDVDDVGACHAASTTPVDC